MPQPTNADLRSPMWHHPLPCGTSWVVTCVTRICPLWNLENARSACHMSFVLPHDDDFSATISLPNPIIFYHMASYRKEKMTCLPLIFHQFPLLNVFDPFPVIFTISVNPDTFNRNWNFRRVSFFIMDYDVLILHCWDQRHAMLLEPQISFIVDMWDS